MLAVVVPRQPRLADAARANDRQQAAVRVGQALGDVGQFGRAPDEQRGRVRQIGRCIVAQALLIRCLRRLPGFGVT